ncbi:zinc-finger-containing protein [Stenotrophomonas geniculata]|uniref:zinc-finger-containing protein n=1 Tax=Stenotrophomonas geniculata TaxID=86188 RepID=UPI002E78547B|nr:zinc-finger-containing protein [Stenotrophomonas geniculata]
MSAVRRPCPVCNCEAKLVTGREVYPHRPDLYGKKFWACLPHGAWVGCHPGSERRMGRLATAETRRLKMAAHAAFDPLWKTGRMKRTKAYAWLREQTGLSERDCHMGWMSDDNLRRVIEICEGAMA